MLAWLDFDSDAMKRAHELLQQFRDSRTLDHLRLSGVRDDFANYFFPATSTIMPHARYLILVPRAFLQLEAEIRKRGYSLQQAVKRLDEIEASQAEELIAELGKRLKKSIPDRKDLEGSGIIGWEKIRETNGAQFVSQTPSNNYWASILKLQIRIPKGSRATYIRDIMARAKSKSARSGVPEEESLGLESVIWNKDAIELAKDASSFRIAVGKPVFREVQGKDRLRAHNRSVSRHIAQAFVDERGVKDEAGIREFFSRMREHRGISLAELAERSKIEMSDLEAFERGDKKASRWIEAAYLSVCCAHHEMEFFCQQAHEFQNPSVKDSKIDVAKAALKQFGVMIPGVDYKRLHSEGGAVLSFPQGGQ